MISKLLGYVVDWFRDMVVVFTCSVYLYDNERAVTRFLEGLLASTQQLLGV
jgi:hypothetical protein